MPVDSRSDPLVIVREILLANERFVFDHEVHVVYFEFDAEHAAESAIEQLRSVGVVGLREPHCTGIVRFEFSQPVVGDVVRVALVLAGRYLGGPLHSRVPPMPRGLRERRSLGL